MPSRPIHVFRSLDCNSPIVRTQLLKNNRKNHFSSEKFQRWGRNTLSTHCETIKQSVIFPIKGLLLILFSNNTHLTGATSTCLLVRKNYRSACTPVACRKLEAGNQNQKSEIGNILFYPIVVIIIFRTLFLLFSETRDWPIKCAEVGWQVVGKGSCY